MHPLEPRAIREEMGEGGGEEKGRGGGDHIFHSSLSLPPSLSLFLDRQRSGLGCARGGPLKNE